jgi:hypothetical protein
MARPDDADWRAFLRGEGPPPGKQPPPGEPEPERPARPGDSDAGKGRDSPIGPSAAEQREELNGWMRAARWDPLERSWRVP